MMEHVKIVVQIYLFGSKVRKNIDGIPVPEVWCIDCVRGNNKNINKQPKVYFFSISTCAIW